MPNKDLDLLHDQAVYAFEGENGIGAGVQPEIEAALLKGFEAGFAVLHAETLALQGYQRFVEERWQ